jgi:hypothetical protein
MNALADCILFECLYQEKCEGDKAHNNATISRPLYAKWVEKVIEARLMQGEDYRTH